MQGRQRYLLVSRIGQHSLHRNWLGTAKTRNFDVVLSAFDQAATPIQSEGILWEMRPGHKVAGYSGFLKERRSVWRDYDFICFFDEDLDATTETLNQMFRLCSEGNFKLAQAALTPDSHYTYAALVRQGSWTLRYASFVEMMCPVFRRDALEEIEHLYHSKWETGIDIVWSQQLGIAAEDIAILDATPVRHTEPVGAKMQDNGFDQTSGYDADIHAILAAYNTSWVACVTRAGLRPSGRLVTSKLLLLLAALPLVLSVPLQSPVAKRLKFVLIHFKHILQAKRPRDPALPAAAVMPTSPTK